MFKNPKHLSDLVCEVQMQMRAEHSTHQKQTPGWHEICYGPEENSNQESAEYWKQPHSEWSQLRPKIPDKTTWSSTVPVSLVQSSLLLLLSPSSDVLTFLQSRHILRLPPQKSCRGVVFTHRPVGQSRLEVGLLLSSARVLCIWPATHHY